MCSSDLTNTGLVADVARLQIMLEEIQNEKQNLLVQCGELTANADTGREFEECRTTIDAKQMHTEVLIESVVAAEPIDSPLRTKFGIHENVDDTYSALGVIQNFANYFSTTLEGQEMKQVKDLFVEFVSYGRIKEGNTYFPRTGHALSDTSLEDVKQVLKALHLATLRTKENLSAFFAINAEREENDLIKAHLHSATRLSDCLFINIHHPTEVRNITGLEPGFDIIETQRQWTEEARRLRYKNCK